MAEHSLVPLPVDPAVPVLTDGVLRLDAYTEADMDAQIAGEDKEHARRFGWFPRHSTPDTVRTYIRARAADWRTHGPTRAWAVRDAATGALLGGCELRLHHSGLARMSWWVFPAHRRKGVATRAVCLVTAYAFASLGVQCIEALIAPDNTASRGVARNAGFRETATVVEGEQRMHRHSLEAVAPGAPRPAAP